MKVIWSDQANEDMDDIYTFLTNIDKSVAERYYRILLGETRKLIKLPLIGIIMEETRHEKNPMRAIVAIKGRYKIIYRVEVEVKAILIARVWDCRKDPCDLYLDRWC